MIQFVGGILVAALFVVTTGQGKAGPEKIVLRYVKACPDTIETIITRETRDGWFGKTVVLADTTSFVRRCRDERLKP